MLAVFLSSVSYSQQADIHTTNRVSDQQIDSILKASSISLEHAEKFNKLIIQDAGGRMKPAHTFASELVRKVSQTEVIHGMQPSQVLLSILENPRLWFEVPAIYLEEGNTKIREIIGVDKEAEFARLSDFYDNKGQSKIDAYIAEAQKKISYKLQILCTFQNYYRFICSFYRLLKKQETIQRRIRF